MHHIYSQKVISFMCPERAYLTYRDPSAMCSMLSATPSFLHLPKPSVCLQCMYIHQYSNSLLPLSFYYDKCMCPSHQSACYIQTQLAKDNLMITYSQPHNTIPWHPLQPSAQIATPLYHNRHINCCIHPQFTHKAKTLDICKLQLHENTCT